MTTSSCCRSRERSSLSGKPPAYLVGSRGILLAQLARYPEALAALGEAIDLAKLSNNTYDIIVAGTARADVRVSMGDVATAARELQDLAPLIESTLASDSSLMQRVLRTRARIAAAEGRLPAAIASYSELIARPEHPESDAGACADGACGSLSESGIAGPGARRRATRICKLARELQRDKQYSAHTGRALAVLARCQQARAESSQARATAGEAAINLAKTLGDDHPDTQWARRTAQL